MARHPTNAVTTLPVQDGFGDGFVADGYGAAAPFEGYGGKGGKGGSASWNRSTPYGGEASLSSGASKLQCVNQNDTYLKHALRLYVGDSAEMFNKICGSTGDGDKLDVERMAGLLDRFTDEGFNRPGIFVSMTAASFHEAAEGGQLLDDFQQILNSGAGGELATSMAYLRRSSDMPRDADATWTQLEAFCKFVCGAEEERLFQRLAEFSGKLYVASMAVLQAKAVMFDRSKLANELELQVHAMPADVRPFLNDPGNDEALVGMLSACYQEQVLAKRDGAGGYLDEEVPEGGEAGFGGGRPGRSAGVTRRGFRVSCGSGNVPPAAALQRGFGRRGVAAGSGFGGKRTNAPEELINVEDVFEEGMPEVKQEPGDGEAPAAAEASGESRAKAAKVTSDFDAAATLEVTKILEQLEDESETNGTLEDEGLLADIVQKVPAPLRQQTGLPGRIDPVAFTEDCKDGKDITRNSVSIPRRVALAWCITRNMRSMVFCLPCMSGASISRTRRPIIKSCWRLARTGRL